MNLINDETLNEIDEIIKTLDTPFNTNTASPARSQSVLTHKKSLAAYMIMGIASKTRQSLGLQPNAIIFAIILGVVTFFFRSVAIEIIALIFLLIGVTPWSWIYRRIDAWMATIPSEEKQPNRPCIGCKHCKDGNNQDYLETGGLYKLCTRKIFSWKYDISVYGKDKNIPEYWKCSTRRKKYKGKPCKHFTFPANKINHLWFLSWS